jgi:adenine-specific DNA-methyltransferase
MAKARKVKVNKKKPIEQYNHKGKKRANNPPVGLVTPQTDKESGRKTYAYDPHLDPQLVWAGKAERTSFEVPTVSLHVHERIDPRTIVEAVRRRNGHKDQQMSLFQSPGENPPLREAIEFYKHPHNWSNRLIAGDSLLVMNSLVEKEGIAGQVQMIYIDPPYGIRYGSNFQPFVNKRDVRDGNDEDLTQEPEMVKAFRDTWELGIHSYLAYLRDRILLSRDLLNDSGSIFVQISDENVHRVRTILDEVFGPKNFVSQISFRKTSNLTAEFLPTNSDFLIWYGKNIEQLKFHPLFVEKSFQNVSTDSFGCAEFPDGTWRRLTQPEKDAPEKISKEWKLFGLSDLTSSHEYTREPFEFEGKKFTPKERYWSTSPEGLRRLATAKRLAIVGETLRYRRYFTDFSVMVLGNIWNDTGTGTQTEDRVYVVQTGVKAIERCLLMTTDPGDLVLDITCGSGTTAQVAEEWGRRWITCDTSRVALTLAKQRLMTAVFDYYELAHPHEGVGSGFRYKSVPHVTLKSIANNEATEQEVLYDQPFVDKSRSRVTGPFTVEAVPAPSVKLLLDAKSDQAADESIARSGETLRQSEWRDELLKSGIRGKKGQYILFSRVEPLPGTRWLQAEAETKPNDKGSDKVKDPEGIYGKPQRVVISFGPEHAPLEQKQVELAIEEAQTLVPKPKIIVFAAFQFDPEAAKDIDETDWPGVTLLKVQMNADLLTEDLKKKRASNESFWLVGQPDVTIKKIKDGDAKGKYRVEVMGFDYYNTKTGSIESGGNEKIAIWMLDTDYDGRSLLPRQVFFPMAGENDGWARLARNLKAEIDEDLIEKYRGTVSLPFEPGKHKRAAVKIVDDRGIESLKLLDLP